MLSAESDDLVEVERTYFHVQDALLNPSKETTMAIVLDKRLHHTRVELCELIIEDVRFEQLEKDSALARTAEL